MPPAVRDIHSRLLEARDALRALGERPHTTSDLQPLQAPASVSRQRCRALAHCFPERMLGCLLAFPGVSMLRPACWTPDDGAVFVAVQPDA